MKKLFVLLFALAVLPATQLFADTGNNGILAVVGNEVVTIQDVALDRQNFQEEADCRKQYQGATLTAHLDEIRLKTLDRLINGRLMVQEFKREGLFFSDAQANDMVTAEIKSDYGGDMDKYHAAIAYYGETEDEYRSYIIDTAIISYMTKENVDKKLTGMTTHDAALQAWVATLLAKTYVKILSTPEK